MSLGEAISSLLAEHGVEVFVLLGGILVFFFIGLVALIVFTRWVVHNEVSRLTSALHKDVIEIGTKLELMVGRKWTDDRLNREFDDLRSVINLQQGSIDKLLGR